MTTERSGKVMSTFGNGERVTRRIVLCVLVSFCLASCAREGPENKCILERREMIEKALAEVSKENLMKDVKRLEAFGTRFPYEKQIEVAEHLRDRLGQYLDDTGFHVYEHWGVDWKNVVGNIPGAYDPEKVVILSAHLDSTSAKRLRYAPGANDNASGCAALLEAARILSKHRFEKSVRFLIFAEEETRQNGSRAYVEGIEGSGEEIIGAINMDMIAYGGSDKALDLVTRPKHRWLVDYVDGVARAFGNPTRKVVRKACY